MGLFRYLQTGLCFVLMFIGVKMLISEYVHIPIGISLGVVGTVLIGSVVASLLFPAAEEATALQGEVALASPADPITGGEKGEHRAA